MRANDFYKTYLMQLDDHLIYEVGKVLLNHVGMANAIRRDDLVSVIHNRFAGALSEPDRKVRRAIEQLRGDGWLIGSSASGEGYYMIQSQAEYDQFRSQYTARAYQVIETAKQMDEAAGRLFAEPTGKQLSLLG
ncbi:MAG: hypothetical protein CL609_23675 [Anaerolineaceae bacterium]|nr:hypothetical protein [Anaerolineaceae bacterium]